MANLTPDPFKKWVDIRNNPEHWNQKFSIIEFHDPNKKSWWTKDYSFIPHWKRFKTCQEWIKNTNFPEYNCKIGWNANNEILLTTQNYFGGQRLAQEQEKELLGKIRKKIHQEMNITDDREYQQELRKGLSYQTYEELKEFTVINLFNEELEQLRNIRDNSEIPNQAYDLSRNDIVILWKKQLYFITSFTYSNNYKLLVQIRARRCQLFYNYHKWTSSQGIGIVNQAPQLIKDPKSRFHYDFCGDLGIKKIFMQPVHSYQPNFALFCMMNRGIRDVSWFQKNNFEAPSDVSLMRVRNKNIKLTADIQQLEGFLSASSLSPLTLIGKIVQLILNNNAYLTVGPNELPEKESLWHYFKSYEERLFVDKNGNLDAKLEERFKKQPHLWDHTTFQFYLFNNIAMTANGRYLGIKEKDGHWILPYKLYINFAPGNLYYRWEFNMIAVKCEISTEATFTDSNSLMRFLTGIKLEAATIGAGINWNPQAGEVEPKHHQGEAPTEQEAQTERMFKNTFRNFMDKTIEPSQFNANTRDLHYSLGEFFNRLTDPIFFIRIEHSELLYNRLGWANNKSTPLNLPLSWKELGTWTQKQGYWKWSNVYLEKDISNFWTNIMNRGYYLDAGEKLTNPNLKYEGVSDYVALGDNTWDISHAEEEVVEKVEIIEEDKKVASGNANDKEWGHGTWIKPTNPAEMSNFLRLGSPFTHPGPQGFCWGCSGYPGSPGTYTPNQDTEIEFILEKSNKGNRQIASCKAGVSYQVRVERVGNELQVFFKSREEKITREVKVKERKTITQEIDQEELDNREEEMEEQEIEGENEEEMEKELGGDKEKDLELEDEPEGETEREQEEEQEQETEKENEQEQEEEKETEKEKEDEKEKESEKEDESEDEDEEEREL